MFEFIYVN